MKDSLGDRQKDYEGIPRVRLIKKMPVIARIDGKAFHTLTRHMAKPYDKNFQYTMLDTALYLCSEIQGVKLGYVQSDEISLLLTDNNTRDTQAWFDNELQKMCSVSASMAASQFMWSFVSNFGVSAITNVRPAFDARFWNLPEHEVVNYFIWRQQDAVRNSIQSLAQANFPHKELHGVSCSLLQEKLFQEKGINWNDCLTMDKRGACIVRSVKTVHSDKGSAERRVWTTDLEIPTFTQDRKYIATRLLPEEPVPGKKEV